MDVVAIHFGPKEVKSEEGNTKKNEFKEEPFKGPKGRKNVWWSDNPPYKAPVTDKPAKRVNLWWRRDLKKKTFSEEKHGHWSGKWKTCDICTLDYPCNHMSAHQLAVKLKERYQKFPVNEDKSVSKHSYNLLIQGHGKVICEEFFKYKSCKHFEKYGKCQFWHPTEELINKKIPLPRCDVCTKLIKNKYCYKHRPPVGEELIDKDKAIMKPGGEVSEMFHLGEMIGYNSALERKIIYGFVVTRKEKNRAYQISVTKTARRLLDVTHGKLYRINGYVSRGWDELKYVKRLYAKLNAELKDEVKTDKGKDGEAETEGEQAVDWGRLFNVKYEKSVPNVHPDEYEDRPDSGGPILFDIE